MLASFYKTPLRQEGKPDKLQNNSLISHSKPHEISYSDGKSPHDARKLYPHFCTVMSKLASTTLSQPAFRPWPILVLPEVCETMLFLLLFQHREASRRGRNLKAATQMLLPQCGRQSLLSLLSLKLENNFSDLCMEQH